MSTLIGVVGWLASHAQPAIVLQSPTSWYPFVCARTVVPTSSRQRPVKADKTRRERKKKSAVKVITRKLTANCNPSGYAAKSEFLLI